MREKKTRTCAAKKTVSKAAETKTVLVLSPENAGFKAGDVYQALASAGQAMTVDEIAKQAKISEEEAILGIGWLFKEGKIKDEDNKIILA